MPDHDEIKYMTIKDIHQEEGAAELSSAPEMRPYIELAKALLQGAAPAAQLEAIRQLPLEKRYLWRIVSALRWGFADLDSGSVKADLATLTPEDLARVTDLLKLRPIQFCVFLRAIIGADRMERMMLQAIAAAKR